MSKPSKGLSDIHAVLECRVYVGRPRLFRALTFGGIGTSSVSFSGLGVALARARPLRRQRQGPKQLKGQQTITFACLIDETRVVDDSA